MSSIQENNTEEENTSSQQIIEQAAETDLNLNTDVIHNRTTTYTSLSELYGVQLFTNQRFAEKQNYENSINLKEKNVLESIFVDKSATKDMDSEITKGLFQKPLVIAKQQGYTEKTGAFNGGFAAGAMLLTIIFVVVLARYLKQGNKKKTAEEITNE